MPSLVVVQFLVPETQPSGATCVSPALIVPLVSLSLNSCMTAPLSGLPLASFFLSLMTAGSQLLRLMCVGRMKSFTAELKESDERLFRYADANPLHPPAVTRPASVRLTAASPNVR